MNTIEKAAPELLESLKSQTNFLLLLIERVRNTVIRFEAQCDYIDSLDGEGKTDDEREAIRSVRSLLKTELIEQRSNAEAAIAKDEGRQ